MDSITYPKKRFFKTAKILSWKHEDFIVYIKRDETADFLKKNISFFDEKNSDTSLFNIVKLFICTTQFLTLYFYSVGNGYKATFMLDQNKVLFEWEGKQ